MRFSYKTPTIYLAVVIFSILISSCGKPLVEPLSFPRELFTVKASDDPDLQCIIGLDKALVEIKDIDTVATPVLMMSGMLPGDCSGLIMKVDPPTTANYIVVTMIASSSGVSDVQDSKPFDINMPIHDLQPGDYHIVINEQKQIDFTFE
jgi:hypothetical protein